MLHLRRYLPCRRRPALPQTTSHAPPRAFSATATATATATSTSSPATAVRVLDGGMGHTLRRRGVEIAGPIGSQQRFLGVALANVDTPHEVEAAHAEFLDAGASVITTNNYAVVPATLALTDGAWGDDDLEALVDRSAQCARNAVSGRVGGGGAQQQQQQHEVAGCLPPLLASYRHDLVPEDTAAIEASYRRIARALSPHVDVLLAETMSCAREAVAAARAAAAEAPDVPLWVAWTLMEDTSGRLRSGETVEEAVGALAEAGLLADVRACLFNCSHVDSVTAALPRLRAALPAELKIEVGAYANAFVTVKSDGKAAGGDYDAALSPAAYADIVFDDWVHGPAGATIVGGCCGIFPEHIRELEERRRGGGDDRCETTKSVERDTSVSL